MIVHIIILISTVAIASFSMTQYSNTHDLITNPTPSISKVGALLCFSMLIFFGMNRTEYIDTSTYFIYFSIFKSGFSTAIEAFKTEENGGFACLTILIKTIFGEDRRLYLLALLFIHLCGFITLFRNYSVNYAFSVFLFITSMEYTTLLNGIRQETAVTLILYMSAAFFEKKKIRFFLMVALASTVHPSVVLWVPVYFFVHEKPWTKKMIIFFIGIAFSVLFLDLFTNVLDTMTAGTDYDGYVATFKDDDGVNVIRFIFFALIPLLAFIKRNNLADAPDYINVCINLSAVAASIYLIGMFTSGILVGRLPIYFTPFNWVLLPYLLDNRKNQNNNLLKIGFYVLYTAYFIYNLLFTSYGMYVSKYLGMNYWP